MACLSLTILPTYLQNLLHVNPDYIFKFFMQFIGALPVVLVYYLSKEYTSEAIAFLAGFVTAESYETGDPGLSRVQADQGMTMTSKPGLP